MTTMVWAAIQYNQKSKLIVMDRDPTSTGNGYTSWSYQLALREGLLPIWNDTLQFQQDNAPIHVSESSINWLLANAIEFIDWPPHSPDLNPIEHAWRPLKRNLCRRLPNLHLLKNNEADRAILIEQLKLAWEEIPQSLIQSLLDSLPRRIDAVIKARGWYTKY